MAIWNTIQLSEIHPDRCDAEYFRKDYQDNLNLLENTGDTITLGKLFKYINRGTQPLYNKKGTLKALRSVNVGFMNFNETRQEYVTEGFFAINTRGKVQKDDVLITSTGVGTLGRTSIWFKNERAFCDGHITILRNGKVDPYFVTAFLNSKYGLKQYDQNFRGSSGQIEIYPYDISKFVIPECLLPHQTEIGNYLREAFKLQTQSQTLYKQATDLLEQELGLDKINFEKPKSYTASFSEVVNNSRSDADFYQTKYRQLDAHINTKSTVPLGSICSLVKGYEVGTKAYTSNGPVFIRVSNLNKEGFKFGNSDKYISQTTYSYLKIYKPKIGDILLTKDGTIGTCYVVDENVSGIISSGIMNLDLIDNSIPKEYLALVINSKICQMQAERECSGALITHWKPEQIRRLRIPILKKEIMQEISELVLKSKEAKKQSHQLLADAKARVEQLIEEAANK